MEKKRILVIDDEEDFLLITKLNLEKTGKYIVKTSPSSVGILDFVREFKPDLVLIDILMPQQDGFEACKKLNDDPEAKKVPIITLSALDKDKDKLMMYKVGVVDYLTKPVERDELIAKIDKVLKDK